MYLWPTEEKTVTFNLNRQNPQVSQLLLVVLGQQSQSLSSIPGNGKGNSHTIPWLHMLRL